MTDQALWFPDDNYFFSYVRSLGANLSGEFTLFQLNAYADQDSALIVTGLPARKGGKLEAKVVQIEQINESRSSANRMIKTIAFSDNDIRFEAMINSEIKKYQLLDLVELKPITSELGAPYVIFGVTSQSLLKLLVTQSIRLGNDQLLLAEMEWDGVTLYLLRMEKPSFFMIQRVLEDHPTQASVFYPALDDVFVAWGYTHPLSELWRNSNALRDYWTFFSKNNECHKVQPVNWTDLYEHMQFSLDIAGPILPVLEKSELATIHIELKLVAKSSDAEPAMWMVKANEQARLEALLAVCDQDDLGAYLLNVCTDEQGNRLLFIREKVKAKNKLFIDFSDRAFAPYRGYQNLYLPVNRELQPNIRRDTYRNLFELKPGENTIVVGDDQYGIVRVSDAGFKPLSSFVDYIIHHSIESLQPLVENSYFDLSVYKDLAKAGFAAEASQKKESQKPQSVDEKQDPAQVKTTNEKRRPGFFERLFGAGDKGVNEPEPVVNSENEQEVVAERRVIENPAEPHWEALWRVKHELQRHKDLEPVLINWLWLREQAHSEEVLRYWYEHVNNVLSSGVSNNDALDTCKQQVLSVLDKSADELSAWLNESIRVLKQHESAMLIKERWLLWHVVLHKNRDIREQARLREQIRNIISEGMVDLNQIPEFIRSRLFNDRRLNDNSGGRSEINAALSNLDVMAQSMKALTLRSMGSAGIAIVARIFSRELSMEQSAIHVLTEFLGQKDTGQSLSNQELLEIVKRTLEFSAAGLRGRIALYLVHSFPNVKEVKVLYHQLLRGIDVTSRGDLDSLNHFLEQREQNENPMQFLSAENRNRFYPTGASHDSGETSEIIEYLKEAVQSADKKRLKASLIKILPEISDFQHDVKIAKLIGELVSAINLVRWESDAADVSEAFLDFSKRLSGASSNDDYFYAVLRFSNLAQGMIELGFQKQAKQNMHSAVKYLNQIGTELDYIDAVSSIVNAIESFEVSDRKDYIASVLQSFVQFSKDQAAHLSPHLVGDWIRVLDQLGEACSSRDKLSMNLFNQYLQQDEFIILNRILNESLS